MGVHIDPLTPICYAPSLLDAMVDPQKTQAILRREKERRHKDEASRERSYKHKRRAKDQRDT